MHDIILPIILATLASGGLWTTIQLMITKNSEKEKEKNTNEKLVRGALLGLLHEQLLYRYNKIIDNGTVSEREFRDLDSYLWNPYSGLGGDGIIEDLRERAKELIEH